MDTERVRQITNKVKQWAWDKGLETDAEDMAQHVLMRLSQNRKASVGHICIDYVRSVYGRTDNKASKNQKTKSNEKRFYAEINDEIHGLETSYDMNIEGMDFSVFQNYLESKERAMITLRFKWGMSESEIGNCFGISESRVSQKLKEIKEKLTALIPEDAR